MRGYWNGLPTEIRLVTGTVRAWEEGDPPQAWWRRIAGQRVDAVEVVLDGVNFGGGRIYLMDSEYSTPAVPEFNIPAQTHPAGQGFHKVTAGGGSPQWGHAEVPLIEVVERAQ